MKRELPEGYKVFITHFRKVEGEAMFMTKFDAGKRVLFFSLLAALQRPL
jgi:hypothetical protein